METNYCKYCKCTQLIDTSGFCSICKNYNDNNRILSPPEEKINRTNIERHLVVYELKMVGKTLIDTIGNDKWFFDFTMTTEQETEFHDYAIKLIRKVFKCRKENAEKTFS